MDLFPKVKGFVHPINESLFIRGSEEVSRENKSISFPAPTDAFGLDLATAIFVYSKG
jgi:hypothetical protein